MPIGPTPTFAKQGALLVVDPRRKMDKHTRSVFLLVHGAWHTSASWDLLVSFLQTQGYETHAINLPSTNAPIDFRGIQADVDEIESQALQLLSSHGTVVVILHSYAGLPGSQAMGNIAPGISMSNDDGSVKTQSRIHIVYLAAYVPLEGQSNQDVIQSGPQGPLPIHLQFDVYLICSSSFSFYLVLTAFTGTILHHK